MYHSCPFITQHVLANNSIMHQRDHSRPNCGSIADLEAPCYGTQGYYRGARAALKLRDYETALQLCSRGMEIDGEAPELQQLRQEAEKQAKVCTCTSSKNILSACSWGKQRAVLSLSCRYEGVSAIHIFSAMSCEYRQQRLRSRRRRLGSLCNRRQPRSWRGRC